jgi:hypothetical protein
MSDGAVLRTEYWNLSTGTVRTGATGHGESLTDMESYLLPLDAARGSALYSWGVAAGLTVQAAAGPPGVTVSTGTALDSAGRLILVPENGTVIIDQTVDPGQLQDVPTVVVGADGVTLPTAGAPAACLLTLTWREVAADSTLANAPVLLHAPWLRLVPAAGFQDTGDQVVLAQLTLDGAGNVAALSTGPRRLVGVPAGRLELRVPRLQDTGTATVDQRPAAALAADENGTVTLSLLAGPAPQTALTIDGLTAQATLAARLIAPALRVSSAAGQSYELSSGTDGMWHFTDASANADRLVVDTTGRVGVGLSSVPPARILHVEGSEVHSGGSSGGFSFAGRDVGRLVDNPGAGERWVWYAQDGSARLWSGFDRISVSASGEGGGLDVARRMRVRQAQDASAGIWFYQTRPNADRGFVGMADDTHIGLWGNTGSGWGLQMDTGTGELQFGGNFGRPGGASTLSLFGSRIGDVGNGILFLRSGGNVVAFDGGDNVGINTTSPQSPLDVSGPATAITARGGGNIFQAGVLATGNIGVWAVGSNDGILASGPNFAGAFQGNVQVTRDLQVTGSISKGGGGFRIDHPADPAGKYLSHSFVESPDMLNVYAGTAVTGDDGEAVVSLPGYFETLNTDHLFQLTPAGQLAQAAVIGGVRENRFTIRTDKPGVTVCWQVTGVRQDKWAQQHRIRPEQDKADADRGLFLHPEVHDQPPARSLIRLPDDAATTTGGQR